MLHIYVNKIPDKFIKYSDAEQIFSNILMKNTVFDDPLSREVMKEIDGVTVKNGLYIETKFGNCSLYQLQTGAKQVLNALYYRDTNIIVPLVEAGPNAIYTLMDISRREGLNTNVYMYDWIEAMDKDDFDCYLDGERITSSMDLCAKICGWE